MVEPSAIDSEAQRALPGPGVRREERVTRFKSYIDEAETTVLRVRAASVDRMERES